MKNVREIALALIAFLLVGFVLPAGADDATYTKAIDNGKVYLFGTKKKENYNVAIHVDGKGLVGGVISRVRIPLKVASNISNLKVWLSKSLNIKTEDGKKVNDADILSQDVEAKEGWVDVTLSDPYTITTDGVYVGYSFDLDKLDGFNAQPIEAAAEVHDGGLYAFTSRTYRKWIDLSAVYGTSTLQVMLSGLKANSASLTVPETLSGEINKETPLSFTLTNYGSAGVKSFDYTIAVASTSTNEVVASEERHVDLEDNALPSTLGVATTVSVSVPALNGAGQYNATVTLTKVNGEANGNESATAVSALDIYKILPKHRAVLEEYTGTWCGYCPRGFVGLEVMNRLYPDDFIGISYHNGDPMEIMSSSSFPSYVTGFPDAYIERKTVIDAYYGFSTTGFGVDKAWEASCSQLAPATVDVSAKLDDSNSRISASANLLFPMSHKSTDYKVEFVLLADSLHGTGSNWKQSNYYAGQPSFPESEFEKFTSGKSYVEGLYYNDVIVATTRLTGKDVALPATIDAEKTYTVEGGFNIAEVLNTSGQPIIQDVRNLRVVALLVDNTTGEIVNANKAKVEYNPAGIANVTAKSAETGECPTEIYDLSGRKLNSLHKGVNILKNADGRIIKVVKR